MNTIKQIIRKLKRIDTALIFPHVNPDGDALGSSIALADALNQNKVDASILIDEELEPKFKFLDLSNIFVKQDKKLIYKNILTGKKLDLKKKDINLSILVDNNTLNRIEGRREAFALGSETMIIDHHYFDDYDADYAFIVPLAPACVQLIFNILKTMRVKFNESIVNALYTGLLTDTGSFKYQNVTKLTHDMAGFLHDRGVNHTQIYSKLFENNPIEKLKLESLMVDRAFKIKDNIVMTYVKREDVERLGANMHDADSLSAKLRGIKDIDIAIVLREYVDNETKVSMRSSNDYDVNGFASIMGGGGHKKAAGFTVMSPIEEAVERVKEKALEFYG